jgi:2-polyprenyl-6-hydroxyphenyl methylase/3-demethylubiquinone-9 3-methyltransferase
MATATIDPAEAGKFDALAAGWWDPSGPMAPLHAMNPVRVGWIRALAERQPGFPGWGAMRVLDVGCGAGLAAEAFARLGASVTGIDAAGEAIAAARAHAAAEGLAIDYRQGAPEDLAGTFDLVLALEVVEHVSDRAAFAAALAARCRPGGMVALSTINRTPRSFLFAKVGAEYVARLLPVGTHDFRKFVRPAELAADLRSAGFRVIGEAGMLFDPLRGSWRIGRDVAVNYLMAGVRAPLVPKASL